MEREKIDRINFLARKSKSEELSDEEKKEQQMLRDEYRAWMRSSFMGTLENTYIVDKEGNKKKFLKEDNK